MTNEIELAVLKQSFDDHLKACNQSRKENAVAHTKLEKQVAIISGRVWWVMGIIVIGFASVLVVLVDLVKPLLTRTWML